MISLEDFVDRFPGPHIKNGAEWKVCCPCHKDSNPSASVRANDDGKLLFHCFGCDATMSDVCESLGVDIAETMGADSEVARRRREKEDKYGRLEATYEYRDERGALILIKERRRKSDGSKTFRKGVPADPGSGWKIQWWDTTKTIERRKQKKPLYMLPELLQAIQQGKVVWFCEGEKDVDRMWREGLRATTADEGAGGAWCDHYPDYFIGARLVLIVPDNDPPPQYKGRPGWQGQKYAVLKRDLLRHKGINCAVLELPAELNGKPVKDCYDYFAAGGTKAGLMERAKPILDGTAPEWIPPWDRPDAPELPDPPAGEAPPPEKEKKAKKSRSRSFTDAKLPIEERCALYADWLAATVEKEKESISWACRMAMAFSTKTKKKTGEDEEKGSKNTAVRMELKVGILCRVVVRWVNHVGKLYYHTDHRDFKTAMFFLRSNKSLCNVDSDWFRSWVSTQTGLNREDSKYRKVWSAIEDEVLHGRDAISVIPEAYWARRGDLFGGKKKGCTVYISNGIGQMARITAKGCEMVDNGTDGVLFPADKTLLPWRLTDTPADPFETCAIWREMEVARPRDRLIFKTWALSLPLCNQAKPPLCVTGGAGSGKTTAVRGLFQLFGLQQRNLTVEASEKGAQNFWVSLNAGGLLLLDNMDTSIKWFANAAEAASTGSDYETKRLYTDSELVKLKPNAWLAVTSLNPAFAASPALADRMLFVTLLRRPEKATKETEIYAEVADARNDGLTFVVDILQKVLADSWNGTSPNRRHPDFGKAAVRIGRALGVAEASAAALEEVEADKYVFNLQNDTFGSIFMRLVDIDLEFDSAAMYERMREAYGDDFLRNNKWSVVRVGKGIEKIWEALRYCYGIERRYVHGKSKYTVHPKPFILRLAHHINDDDDQAEAAPEATAAESSPAAPSDVPSAAPMTPDNAVPEFVSRVFGSVKNDPPATAAPVTDTNPPSPPSQWEEAPLSTCDASGVNPQNPANTAFDPDIDALSGGVSDVEFF